MELGLLQPANQSRVQRYTTDQGQTISARHAIQDCLLISLVVLVSSMLYIRGLGFYLDDWLWLKRLAISDESSVQAFYEALYAPSRNMRKRPIQVLSMAVLYRLFGREPLGYHLVNAAVLLGSIVLLYLVLRELGRSRLLALSVPLVYALLPHYSTARFWIASSVAPLSMALYFSALYADLRAVQARKAPFWIWKLLSLLSLLGSGLAYEVALPLFFINPVLIWWRARQLYGPDMGTQFVHKNAAALLASNLLVTMIIAAFKVLTTISLGDETGYRLGAETSYLRHIGYIVKGPLTVSYGTFGLGLPYVLWWILRNAFSWSTVAIGFALGSIIFGYLLHVTRQTEDAWPGRSVWRTWIAAGLVVFGLGYAIFLTTSQVSFSSAGIDNRIAIAAAVGIAMTYVGGIGWLLTLIPPGRNRTRAFCLLVAMLCMVGFLITSTLGHFWVEAYRQQQAIAGNIRQQFPRLPRETTLILDGACPLVGPGVVFTSGYDLASVLQISYGDHSLHADVATAETKAGAQGISIREYEYPYAPNLLLYNHAHRMSYRLDSLQSARRYFDTSFANKDCSAFFAWGLNGRY